MKLHDECDILMSLYNECEHVLYNQHADHCFATQYVGKRWPLDTSLTFTRSCCKKTFLITRFDFNFI